MAIGLEVAVESMELDAFAPKIEDLVYEGKTLYTLLRDRATAVPSSNITSAGGTTRPAYRVPFRVQEGTAISQGTGNGDSLGRGTMSQWAAFAVSPVFTYGVNEMSYLSQIATDGSKRSKGQFELKAVELRNALRTYEKGLEAQSQGDGSGTLDTIPAAAAVVTGASGSITGMNIATQFQDQQLVTVYGGGEGGSSRGTFTITFVDTVTNTLYGNVPAGTTNGDALAINGSNGSATAGNAILGLHYWQNNATSGTIGGLNRATFPGRLSTPAINLAGAPITQGTGIRANILMGRALGQDNPLNDNAIWYAGPDQGFSISNLYLNVMLDVAAQEKGKEYPDMARRGFPKTFAGRELHVGYNATPGRLDLFNPESWSFAEMLTPQLYDFGGGVNVVPVPDITNGGYLTSHQFAFVSAFNLANSNVRAGCVVTSAAQPTV